MSPFHDASCRVFYDVQLAAADELAVVWISVAVAAHTSFELRWHCPLQRPDQCALLNTEPSAQARILDHMMQRSVLFVV